MFDSDSGGPGHPGPSDRHLARLAAVGDNNAIAQLYDRYEHQLLNYCHRTCGNADDAADATQEAFCNVIARLPNLDTDELNFAAYLYTSARNACLDLIKQSKRAEPTDEVPEDSFAVMPLEADPERALLTSDQQRAAREANERLPEKQRTVLALREIAELSYDDIAATMGMNANSVAQLISRARINFFKQLRAAAVVLPPLDETGRRAVELVAARQDGQIADDELNWLEQHLRENAASRVNAEAMQESTKLYRAIGPLALIIGLRDQAIARASALVRQNQTSSDEADHDQPSGNGESAADDSQSAGISPPSGHGYLTRGLARAGTESAAADAAGATQTRRKRRQRTTAIVLTLMLAGVTSLALVDGLSDGTGPIVEQASQAGPSASTAQATQVKPKKKQRAKQSDDSTQAGDSGIETTSPGISERSTKKPSKKLKSKGEPDKPATDTPAGTPPDPAPDDPPATTPDPPAPTGPTGRTPPPKPPVKRPCGRIKCPTPPVIR